MTLPHERTLYGEPGADGRTPFWRMTTIWAAAAGRPQVVRAIDDLQILDAVVWFGGPKNIEPTVRRVAEHARDIFNVDLGVPIILTRLGDVLDGAHRIARAFLEGVASLPAVILEDWPLPDGFVAAAHA